jgi:hypothetical protein
VSPAWAEVATFAVVLGVTVLEEDHPCSHPGCGDIPLRFAHGEGFCHLKRRKKSKKVWSQLLFTRRSLSLPKTLDHPNFIQVKVQHPFSNLRYFSCSREETKNT